MRYLNPRPPIYIMAIAKTVISVVDCWFWSEIKPHSCCSMVQKFCQVSCRAVNVTRVRESWKSVSEISKSSRMMWGPPDCLAFLGQNSNSGWHPNLNAILDVWTLVLYTLRVLTLTSSQRTSRPECHFPLLNVSIWHVTWWCTICALSVKNGQLKWNIVKQKTRHFLKIRKCRKVQIGNLCETVQFPTKMEWNKQRPIVHRKWRVSGYLAITALCRKKAEHKNDSVACLVT